MKRILFSYLLLLVASASQASNDTLTRAEIYNWSVGDTFDYLEHNIHPGGPLDTDTYSTFSYSRYIVSNIYWSTDSFTKTITSKEIFGQPMMSDSLVLGNLSGFEVIMDTIFWVNPGGPTNYYQMNSPTYFSQPTNFTYYFSGGSGFIGILFAQNFGQAIYIHNTDFQNIFIFDTISLIYYSGFHGVFGTPYTSFPTAVTNILISTEKISVFPTLSKGKFTVIPPNDAPLPINFVVYDLQGRMLRQFVLNQRKDEIDITGLAKGMYIWKSVSEEARGQTGRLIIQ